MQEHESKLAAGCYDPFRLLMLSEQVQSMACMLAKLGQGTAAGHRADTVLDVALLQRLLLATQTLVAERAESRHTALELTLQGADAGMPGRWA